MRSIAGGATAGGSLALVHHLLSLTEAPHFDPLTFCNPHFDRSWDSASFLAGLLAGALLVLVVQAFCTLRWAFIAFVQLHCGQTAFGAGDGSQKKQLYKLL